MCSCFEARKRALEMKGAQFEDTFPSLFEICAAEIEEELACARCQFCNSEDGNDYKMLEAHLQPLRILKWKWDERLPPLHLLKWTQDARLQPKLVFVDERFISPPSARIARTPPLFRPSVSQRVT